MSSRHVSIAVLVVTILFIVPRPSCAEEEDFVSALFQSVSGVYTIFPGDAGEAISNPALMALTQNSGAIGLSYRQPYGLHELEELAVQARYRRNRFALGIGANRLGESGLYQEFGVTGSIGIRLHPKLSAGAAISYSSAEFGDGVARYSGATAALSGAYGPAPSVLVAVGVRNIALDSMYGEADGDPIIEASAAWLSAGDVTVGGVWAHDETGHRFALGQRLQITTGIEFLSGLRFDPIRYSLGGRLSHQNFAIIYAYLGHPDLGATHTFGLTWQR